MTHQRRTLVSMALIPAAFAIGFVHSAAAPHLALPGPLGLQSAVCAKQNVLDGTWVPPSVKRID